MTGTASEPVPEDAGMEGTRAALGAEASGTVAVESGGADDFQ